MGSILCLLNIRYDFISEIEPTNNTGIILKLSIIDLEVQLHKMAM